MLLLLMISSSFFNFSKAQQIKTINLQQAVQMAIDSNLSVQSSAYSMDVQKSLKSATWDIPKTVVEGQYGQFNSYSKDNSFTVSQTIAFPTVYINQSKLATANIKSSEWQYKASQLEIATQVKQVYWQLSFLHAKRKLLIYQDSLFSGFLRAAELRAKIGETNKLEMITARSQSLEVQNQLKLVTADLDIFNRKLLTLLNTKATLFPADTILRRADFIPIADSSALAGNPSLGFVQQQKEISRFEKKLEQSRMLPDFSIGYFNQSIQGTQDVNGTPSTFGLGDRFTGIQAGIAIPVWFGPYTAKTKAAKLNELIAQTNAEYYTKSLTGSYLSLIDEYNKYNRSVEYYEKQALPEADLIIDQAALSFKGGAMDYLDYILSLNRALSIKHNYLDALNSYNQTIINIEFITGKIF